MNWDQVQGKWNQIKGSVKERWGKLTDDDLQFISGRQDQLIGKLQERYGIAHEEAQRRADEWIKTYQEAGSAHQMAGSHTGQAGRKS